MNFLTVEKLLNTDCYYDVIINIDQITEINRNSNLIFLSDGRDFIISDYSMNELLRYLAYNLRLKEK